MLNTEAQHQRKALIVLGMHRSGTSALSGVLALLGASAPKTQMIPTPSNPKGYWESPSFQRLHDQLLRGLGCRWNYWGPFNPDWTDSAAADEFRFSLPAVLEAEFEDADCMLIKDPRMCLLLPLWLQVLNDLNIEPKIVLPIRNPMEIANSLAKRDGFNQDFSLLLWLRHILDAESHSRGQARIFVRYSDLLANWKGVAHQIDTGLDLALTPWPHNADGEVKNYLSRKLRHHIINDKRIIASNKILSRWTEQVYKIMNSFCESIPANSSNEGLDKVKAEFDSMANPFAAAIKGHDALAELHSSELKKALKKTEEELKESLIEAQKASVLAAQKKITVEKIKKISSEKEAILSELQNAERRSRTQEELIMKSAREIAEMKSTQEKLLIAEAVHSSFDDSRSALQDLIKKQMQGVQNDLSDLINAQRLALDAAVLRTEASEQKRKILEDKLHHLETINSRALEDSAQNQVDMKSFLAITQENESLRLQLNERFDEVAALTQVIEDLERRSEKSISSVRAQLATANSQLETARSHGATQKKQLEAAKIEVQKSKELAEHLKLESSALRSKNEEILSSTSWRLTAPIRTIISPLKKLFA